MRRNFAQALVPTEPFDHNTRLRGFPKAVPQFQTFSIQQRLVPAAPVIIRKCEGWSTAPAGLLFTTAYTWAKSIDNKSLPPALAARITGWQGFIDNHNAKLEHARSDFDVDHRLVSSFVYNLPLAGAESIFPASSRAADLVVGGWQLNGIVTFQRGFPYSIYAQDKGGVLDDFDNRAHLHRNPNSGFHQSIAECSIRRHSRSPTQASLAPRDEISYVGPESTIGTCPSSRTSNSANRCGCNCGWSRSIHSTTRSGMGPT